jgi:CRP/FNR family transcriptional regulator
MEMDKEAVLARIGLFEGISSASRKALADICLPKQATKGQTLFLEGAKGLALYVLVTGSVQLYKTAPDGRRIAIKVVKPGELFAEVVLFEQATYPVNAVALTSSMVYVVPRREFGALLADERFRNEFIAGLMTKLRYLADQIKYLTSHDVEDRFFAFLQEHCGRRERIVCALSKKQVAAAIGTTPESLSRMLLRLRKEHGVTWQGRAITVPAKAWGSVAAAS